MREQELVLPPGDHMLEQPILDCRVAGYDGERDLAKLLLTVDSHQTEGTKLPAATKLAIYVKREAAIRLLLDLHKISNAMSWPLQEQMGS